MEASLILLADALAAMSVALMIFILKLSIKQEKRIQRMESDLYLDSKNPTSMPLTKQVFNLQKDVTEVKKSVGKLDESMEKINEMVTHFYNSNFKK